jgi:hypothetical protein
LTSLADPDSIRVAGTTDDNPARINDLTVDLVNNLYSSLSTLLDFEEEESDDEDEEEPQTLQEARQALQDLNIFIDRAREKKDTSSRELLLLERVSSLLFQSC